MPHQSPRFSLPPLTSPSPPPQRTNPNATTAQRPKRSALEPPAFAQTRSTSPRQHLTSPRSRSGPTHRDTSSRHNHDPRNREPANRSHIQEDRDLAALAGWSPDALDHVFTSSPQVDADVTFLHDIADNEFSSPSNYPSFTGDSTAASIRHGLSRTLSDALTSTNPNARSRTETRILHDLDIMPPTARRRRESTTSVTRASKRRRTATPTPRVKAHDDDPFASSPQPLEDPSLIDLTADDGKADLERIREEKEREREKQKEEDGRIIKLAKFQCVICMDDATNLTTTHCGHLFCADCLYSSLNVETTRGRCPMCRSKLETKPREQYNARTKGFYPLEIKVMTKTKSGKRKINRVS